MSRPFRDTFEDERSPLTPLSGGPQQSISYQANVNRRKTKKWADAKPVSYGGDDWGDEYDDEYDAAPPQQDMSKPTGYRQPGQGIGGLQQPAGNYNEGRKPYGDLSSGPPMGADRGATLPHQLHRNSFGEDDERRAFSSGPTQFPPQSGQEGPQLYVQTQQPQQQNMGGFRGPDPQPMETPPIQAPGAFPETPYSVHDSQRSYIGEQNQQYFQQPYQQTQPVSPVNARGTPVQPGYGRNASPVSGGRPGSAGNFAPRKSSLSQGSVSEMGYGSHSRERSQEPVMKPWPGPGVASPGGTAPPAPKALPFVRPADIYKRLEEERTKERQSMESGRPSMDSISGDRGRQLPPPVAPPSSAISPPQDQYTRDRSGSQSDSFGITDSGRRLGQSLEPVAERKSEYSFMDASTRSPEVAQKLEDIKRIESSYQSSPPAPSSGAPIYNVVEQFSIAKPSRDPQGLQESAKQPYPTQHAEVSEHDSSFEAEEHRRFSNSPKLPDLNRLSDFGFDLWRVNPNEPEPSPASEPSRPVVAPVQPAARTEEHTLRQEPSLGFNSVVHQAFDRNDSFSDARDPQRTDSETSVGTSDISPIVPKAAFITDDQATPVITEESEPNSRRGSGHVTPKQEFRPATPEQQMSFLPGHRRDLSAPISAKSRDNSPARTPIVRQGAVVGPGVQVHVSETSPSPEEEKQIDDAARYERYPRPPIPGGWQSYATIGGESIHRSDEPNVNVPADTSKIAPFTAQIIASNPLPDEFSPTIAARTEEIRPPSPEVTPVIQPPAADEHSPFIAKQMQDVAPPSPAPEHAPDTRAPDAFSPSLAREMDIVALPTPDPHMGPMGNPYSQAALDPRIDGGHSQPETPMSSKSADTITGLAPPAINEQGISPGSSVGPTPPPKDTPRMPGFGHEGYFPPPVPLKPKTAEEVAAAEGLEPPTRPVMMTSLSTNTMPYDDENDKLRKEIVKSLSPRQSVSGPSSQAQHQPGQSMLGVGSSDATRESTYLPSEYDSYWGANEDEPSHYSQTEAVKAQPENSVIVNIEAASPSSEKSATPPIPPLNPKRASRTSMGSIPGITHSPRYSFDQGQETRLSTDDRIENSTPAVVAAPVSENKPWTPSLAGNGSAKGRLPADLQRADSASPAPLSIRSAKTDKASEISSEKPKEEETPAQGILGMAVAAGAAVAATLLPIGAPSAAQDDQAKDVEQDTEKDVPSLKGIVVDEDDRVNDKALSAEVSPVSAMSPTQDIPPMMNVVSPPSGAAHQPHLSMSKSAMLPSPLNISRPTTAQTNSPRPQNAASQPPPMQFREIMVMPSPEQRIEAYNKARAQYASMDSGLADWLAVQTGQAGPHTPPHGLDGGRSRAGSVAQGVAAPYYKQFNADAPSPAASTPVSNMGTPQRQSTLGAMGLGTQGGLGGGRSTSQQQAQIAKEKGKELLHSAGIFGGAVGKKGKGLFKKGTSRWLGGGSGSGDKETPPVTPMKDPNYTPSVRSASYSTTAPSAPFATSGQSFRDPSPASSWRRGPYPDLGPQTESPRPTPTKRRTSWLPHFGSSSGRPPSRGKTLDSHGHGPDGRSAPRRAFSHDISNMLHGQSRKSMSQDEQVFRPPFFHHHSGSRATSQGSLGPGTIYASPQHSFGPGPQYTSPQGSYVGNPGQHGRQDSFGRQRSDSLPLPPGVMIDTREVSSVASNTPPVAPQVHLDLPPTTLRDEHWLSTSPAHSATTSAAHSNSPRPSIPNSSRHHSGVPSLTDSQRLENEERRDSFNVDKELPSLVHVQDDHEHTGVKPPVPIGKYQPSWDPFNATPIQEEREGSEYSFGAGKISPPKISPPVLDTVLEAKRQQDASQNDILAGAAGVGLAAGAATTAAVIAEQIQERRTEFQTTEIEEDDIYDASPPPKSKRRSLEVRLAPPPAVLAAGTAATASAITPQMQEEQEKQASPEEEWTVVEHADAPVQRDEPSYFPPITTQAPTPPINSRLDVGHSRNQSRVHSRGISEVSAVSAMSIGTMSPGEVVDASSVTIERQPSPPQLRNSGLAHETSWTPGDDALDLAPPKPAFMMGKGRGGERTPTMEDLPGGFPQTPFSEAPGPIKIASVKSEVADTDKSSPYDEETPTEPGSHSQGGQTRPIVTEDAALISRIDDSWPQQRDQWETEKMRQLPEPEVERPTYVDAPVVIGDFGAGVQNSREPESRQRDERESTRLSQADTGEERDIASMLQVPREVEKEKEQQEAEGRRPGEVALKQDEDARSGKPDIYGVSDDEDEPYPEAIARLDNVRNNTQQIIRVAPDQGVAVSQGPQLRQRTFNEAEKFRVANASKMEDYGFQRGMTVSREPQVRQRTFAEAERTRAGNEEVVRAAMFADEAERTRSLDGQAPRADPYADGDKLQREHNESIQFKQPRNTGPVASFSTPPSLQQLIVEPADQFEHGVAESTEPESAQRKYEEERLVNKEARVSHSTGDPRRYPLSEGNVVSTKSLSGQRRPGGAEQDKEALKVDESDDEDLRPDSRQLQRRGSVELARARSKSRVRSEMEEEEQDDSRPHVVHFAAARKSQDLEEREEPTTLLDKGKQLIGALSLGTERSASSQQQEPEVQRQKAQPRRLEPESATSFDALTLEAQKREKQRLAADEWLAGIKIEEEKSKRRMEEEAAERARNVRKGSREAGMRIGIAKSREPEATQREPERATTLLDRGKQLIGALSLGAESSTSSQQQDRREEPAPILREMVPKDSFDASMLEAQKREKQRLAADEWLAGVRLEEEKLKKRMEDEAADRARKAPSGGGGGGVRLGIAKSREPEGRQKEPEVKSKGLMQTIITSAAPLVGALGVTKAPNVDEDTVGQAQVGGTQVQLQPHQQQQPNPGIQVPIGLQEMARKTFPALEKQEEPLPERSPKRRSLAPIELAQPVTATEGRHLAPAELQQPPRVSTTTTYSQGQDDDNSTRKSTGMIGRLQQMQESISSRYSAPSTEDPLYESHEIESDVPGNSSRAPQGLQQDAKWGKPRATEPQSEQRVLGPIDPNQPATAVTRRPVPPAEFLPQGRSSAPSKEEPKISESREVDRGAWKTYTVVPEGLPAQMTVTEYYKALGFKPREEWTEEERQRGHDSRAAAPSIFKTPPVDQTAQKELQDVQTQRVQVPLGLQQEAARSLVPKELDKPLVQERSLVPDELSQRPSIITGGPTAGVGTPKLVDVHSFLSRRSTDISPEPTPFRDDEVIPGVGRRLSGDEFAGEEIHEGVGRRLPGDVSPINTPDITDDNEMGYTIATSREPFFTSRDNQNRDAPGRSLVPVELAKAATITESEPRTLAPPELEMVGGYGALPSDLYGGIAPSREGPRRAPTFEELGLREAPSKPRSDVPAGVQQQAQAFVPSIPGHFPMTPAEAPQPPEGAASPREDFTHERRNVNSQQSRLLPVELAKPLDRVESRSIVPLELQQAQSSQYLPSLSVPKHRSSPSKDISEQEQRNPDSPSTTVGSGFTIPPVRRTSTFGFSTVRKAKPAKGRFSIDDDDETGDESPHIVSPMSASSINAETLPEAPRLRREEAVANSPDLRQALGQSAAASPVADVLYRQESVQSHETSRPRMPGSWTRQTLESGVIKSTEPQSLQRDRPDTGAGSLRRTSNVPRRASQDRPVISPNRFSYQKTGEQAAQTEVLSRPPAPRQSSSDYDQAWTGQSTPTPLNTESQRTSYVNEPMPYAAAEAVAAGVGIAQQRSESQELVQQQQHEAQRNQQQNYQNLQQARGIPPVNQQRQSSYDVQQQHGPPVGTVGPPGLVQRYSQGPLGPNAAYPQRPSMDGQRQRPPSMESQHLQQRPPSLGGVGTMPAQPPKIVPQYMETAARPLSYTRSGARDGPPGIPPSSAERYPELFQSAQPADSSTDGVHPQSAAGHVPNDGRQQVRGDLPGEYPVVGKGHLPRQQATEYHIPGVGPPADDPRNENGNGRSSRRNSGFLKEIGGRLSRGSSRERRASTDRRPASMKRPVSHIDTREDNLVISRVEDRRLESRDSDDISLDDEKVGAYEKKDKPRRRSLLDVFHPQRTAPDQQQQQQPVGERPPSQVESMITHRPNSRSDLLANQQPSSPASFSQIVPEQNIAKEEKSKKKWSFFGKNKGISRENSKENNKENAGVILATAGLSGGGEYNTGIVPRGQQAQLHKVAPSHQQQPQMFSQQPQMSGGVGPQGQQQFDPRDPRFQQLQPHQQQRMSQPAHQQQQQFTNEQRIFGQNQVAPQRTPVPQQQPIRHPSLALAQQESGRPTQSPTASLGSLPPPAIIPGAFSQQATPSPRETPVIAPQPGRGPVSSEFTPRDGTPASTIQQAPPVMAHDGVLAPRTPLGSAPVQQQQQQPQRFLPGENQNLRAYQQSASQIGHTPYNQLPQGQPPRGQHQVYAAQLAQGPPQLKKTNSDANRLQKKPSSASSSLKGKEPKEKKKGFLSGLLSSRRQSAVAEKEKKVPLVAAGVTAQHQHQQQRFSQQQMSGAMPPQDSQQFDPRAHQWHQLPQQQQQFQQGPPMNRQLQGGPQPQQQYASPPIPGPYAYVRGDGSFGSVNQGSVMFNQQQQQQAVTFRHPRQQHMPAFADQRSYDEYMRQQQAAQAQQQGYYANLPPPPAQSYYQGKQESVPPNFRRASQEYVRDLNQRSSQEYRRDSNPMAGGQQLDQTQTQQQAAQRPPPQRKEIAVAIPAWKRAIRGSAGNNSPVQQSEPSPPPVLGPQNDFPNLSANPNNPQDTPEPQARSRPFLGLNDDRRTSNLSTEDLLARSPARGQFGQQAPYQLSLPGGDDDDEMDSPHSRRSPSNALVGAVPVALGAAAVADHRDSRGSVPSPLREQYLHQGPSNVPLPDTPFSPIEDRGMRGADIPPPPIPKWSAPPTPTGEVHNVQLGHPQHNAAAGLLHPGRQPLLYDPSQMLSPNSGAGVGRSNTVMSDVSSITVASSHHTPSPRQQVTVNVAQGYGHRKSIPVTSGQQLAQVQKRDSVSAGSSPNDTPVVSNAQSAQTHRPSLAQSKTDTILQRVHIPSDIRPPPLPQTQVQAPSMLTARAPNPPLQQQAPSPPDNAGHVNPDDTGRAERPTVLTQHPDHSGLIYDNSREGLIVVEDSNVRRVNQGGQPGHEEDEGPVMSATSFPGDEWTPYGWDEGGFDYVEERDLRGS